MSGAGKVAIITGGGTGIGRAAALALQGDGWNVVVTGRRKAEPYRISRDRALAISANDSKRCKLD